MTPDQATFVLTIIGAVGAWTASVIIGMVWLNGKFATLEKVLYSEMDKHRREDDAQFDAQGRKIQRLEFRVFGFSTPELISDAILPPPSQ